MMNNFMLLNSTTQLKEMHILKNTIPKVDTRRDRKS